MLYIYKISFELILFWFLILIFQYNTIFDIYKTLFHFSFYQYLLKTHFLIKKLIIYIKLIYIIHFYMKASFSSFKYLLNALNSL